MRPDVLVVGAQGVLGQSIAEQLSSAGWAVTRGGRRPGSEEDFRQLDLADSDAVSRACEDFDLIINTAHHSDLILEKTVLGRGGTLIDLIELSEIEQARLDSEASDVGGLVALHTGLGGIAYMAIADMLRKHSDADSAEYALMVSATGSGGRAGGLFAHRLLTSSSHHASATIPFPEPFGTHRCLEVGAEFGVSPRARVGTAPVRHYLYMQPRALNSLMRALNSARILSAVPRAMFTSGRGSSDRLSAEPICEWAAVSRDGLRLTSCAIEGRGYYRMTAAATLVFAEALSRNNRPSGVRSIDEILSLPELLHPLERAGITVRCSEPAGETSLR